MFRIYANMEMVRLYYLYATHPDPQKTTKTLESSGYFFDVPNPENPICAIISSSSCSPSILTSSP